MTTPVLIQSHILPTPPEERLLFHYHVPKTAGTTYSWMIRTALYAQSLRLGRGCMSVHADFDAPMPEASPDLCHVSGHVTYGRHLEIKKKAVLTTMLRDPVDRVLSEYVMGVRGGWIDDQVETMIDFLLHPGNANLQTAFLSGVGREGEINQAALDKAKDNLAKEFMLVAPMTDFNAFMKILLSLFGWPSMVYTRTQVGSYDRENFAQPVRPKINEVAQYDRALLAFAAELFEEQKEKYAVDTCPRQQDLWQVPENFYDNYEQKETPHQISWDVLPSDITVI